MHTLLLVYHTIQDAAERLDKDATEKKDTPAPMVGAAKKIASMWMEMAQLIKSEFNTITKYEVM